MQHIEEKMASGVLERIDAMFYGWCHASIHYVSIFFTYPTQNSVGYASKCVFFTSHDNEEEQSADEHLQLIKFVLAQYKNCASNVVAVITDSCGVNKAIAIPMGAISVSCVILSTDQN